MCAAIYSAGWNLEKNAIICHFHHSFLIESRAQKSCVVFFTAKSLTQTAWDDGKCFGTRAAW